MVSAHCCNLKGQGISRFMIQKIEVAIADIMVKKVLEMILWRLDFDLLELIQPGYILMSGLIKTHLVESLVETWSILHVGFLTQLDLVWTSC